MKTLIVIAGPTGVGKTDISIDIAKHFNTQIISADSRQIYEGLIVATAQPSAQQLTEVKHYMIGCKLVYEPYNAGKFEIEVIDILNTIFQNNQVALMVGGSGLYIDAVCNGIDDLPKTDFDLRNQLIQQFENEGIESIRTMLKKLDPEYYNQVDLRNSKRILKALEVSLLTGKPYSSFRTQTHKKRDFMIIKIGFDRNREELYERINKRVEIMVDDGLVDEARKFWNDESARKLNALNTVGYKELFAHFSGQLSLLEAIERIQANSRKYARKQLTWFHRDKSIAWFHPNEKDSVIKYLNEKIASN